jgi:hypothetical protein
VAREWAWRIADRERTKELRLRYEPGSHGDLLKGVWLAEICAALALSPSKMCDPFAGAPDYPATERAVATIALGSAAFRELQTPFVARGRIASTAGMLAGHGVDAAVFDLDAERRDAWRAVDGARVMEIDDGWAAFATPVARGSDVVLVDPYDLHQRERWTKVLGDLAALRDGGAHLVLYLYNRASQGVGQLRSYRRLRDDLASALGKPVLVGRLPTDAALPRAWHELLLFAGTGGRAPLGSELVAILSNETRRMAAAIAAAGAVEP